MPSRAARSAISAWSGQGLVARGGQRAQGYRRAPCGRKLCRRVRSARSTPRSTRRGGTTSSATTARPTWSTTCFGDGWAPMCGSRAPWSSPTVCVSTSLITGRSTPTTLQAIESDVNDLILDNDVVSTREMPYRRCSRAGRHGVFLGEIRRRGSRGSDGAVDRALRWYPRADQWADRDFPLLRPVGRRRRCPADRGRHRRTRARAVRELEQRVAAVAEALKSQPEHLVRRVEQLLEERTRLEISSGRSAPVRRRARRSGGDVSKVAGVRADDRPDRQRGSRRGRSRIADRFREGKRTAVLVLFSSAGRGAIHVTLTDDLVSGGPRRETWSIASPRSAVGRAVGGRTSRRPALATPSGCRRRARRRLAWLPRGWKAAGS